MTTQVTDLTDADVFGAVSAFIAAFAAPEISDDGKHIIPGFADDQSLPADGNDFAVYTPVSAVRQGVNVQNWHETADVITDSEYVEEVFQLDFYSASPVRARARALALEVMARSGSGVSFMADRHVDLLFAENPRNLSAVLDSGKYVSRWSVDLHIGHWHKLRTAQDYAETAEVEVVNVDVEYPPQ